MQCNQSVTIIKKGYGLDVNILQNFLPAIEQLKLGLNLLLQDLHPYPFATGHWRIDIGAGGEQARRHQEYSNGQ